MVKEKIYFLVYPPPEAWKIQQREVLDSILGKSRFSPNVERCSKPRGYPQKTFSDNLTNIDTNSKKNVRIFGGGSATPKNPLFRDPCFAQFSDAQPKMTNTKPMSQNREAAPITNQPPNHPTNIYFYYKLIPWPKVGLTDSMTPSLTNPHIIQIYSQG